MLERAAEEAGWREAEGDLMRGKEGAQSEVQRLATEQRSRPLRQWRTGFWRPICGRGPSYGRRPSYDDPMLRKWMKGRDPGQAHQRRNAHRTRAMRRTAMGGQRWGDDDVRRG